MLKKIKLDEETYIREKDLPKPKVRAPGGDKSNPFMEVGKDYFIRTVTHYYTGRLIWVGEKEIVLESVCWIADTGRFNEFVKGGSGNETEPFPVDQPVVIGRGAIIDMTERVGGLLLVVK